MTEIRLVLSIKLMIAPIIPFHKGLCPKTRQGGVKVSRGILCKMFMVHLPSTGAKMGKMGGKSLTSGHFSL